MQAAIAVRKSSINSIVATFAILLALTAGATAGYWLKSQAAAARSQPPQAASTIVNRGNSVQAQVVDPWESNLASTSASTPDAVERALAKVGSVDYAVAGARPELEDSHLFISAGPADYLTQHEDSHLVVAAPR